MDISAELISIGDELLSGRTLNTHGQDLGKALAAIGLQLVRDTTILDDIPTIGTALKEALDRTGLVFVSGGLGPTVDDITRDGLAAMLGQEIVLDGATVAIIAKRYAARGRAMTPAAERQALVLEDATVLPNSVGAAPGQRIELAGEKTLFVLPGPPGEFNAILNEEILPWLRERFPDARPRLVRIVRTKGIGESDIVRNHVGLSVRNSCQHALAVVHLATFLISERFPSRAASRMGPMYSSIISAVSGTGMF